MTVRAAIIGLGRWGRSLVNAVHGKTDAIEFTAAYTRTRAGAEDYCREKNLPLLDRFEEVLSDPNIDAVVLATPHSQHAEQVMAAAVAGKHIHVEKPLTLDRPPEIFGGKNTLHFGEKFAPYLLLPIIPKSA